MRIKFIIGTLCYILPVLLMGQPSKEKVFKEEKKTPARTLSKKDFANTRSDEYIFDKINRANRLAADKPELALNEIEQALGLAYKTRNIRAEAYAFNTLGAINYKLSRYDVAAKHCDTARIIFEKIGDKQGQYHSLKYLAMSEDGLGKSEKALVNYLKVREKAKLQKDNSDLIDIENRISRIRFNAQEYDQALEGYHRVLALQQNNRDSSGIVQTFLRLGRVNQQLGNTPRAINYFEDAGSLANRIEDQEAVDLSLDYIGEAYRSKRDLPNELQVQQKNLESSISQNKISKQGKLSKRIGEIYVEQNKIQEAIPYFKTSIDLAGELGELKSQQEAYQALASAYEKAGDFDAAIENFKGAIELTDKIQEQELVALADSISFQQQLYQKDMKIAMLRKSQELSEEKFRTREQLQSAKIARQATIMYSMLAGFLLILVSGFFILRSYQARRKANQLLMLKSLRSQMNPHFIFNSLNSINSFIAKQDERSANKYLSSFSRLMRTVLENSQQDFVPLATEIEVLERYLSLEHFRFQDKFSYEFVVDPAINRDQVDIPPMLIQPYVENAIWHGLRYKEEEGLLRLLIQQKQDHLHIQIEDNGIGRMKSKAIKTKHQKAQKSTGLKNTEARLRIINELYKKEVSVEISDLDPDQADVGTRVDIKLPIG